MAKKISAVQLARRLSLGLVLVGMTVLMVLHQKIQGFPSIDAIDPFGGLETLMKFIAGGELIKKIEPGNIVLLGGVVALGVVLSRFFCGWFCGFGALQGVFGWLGRKIFKRRFTVPKKLDRVLRFVKYPLLLAIVALTWRTGSLIIRPYDPLAAYGHISAGLSAVWAEFSVGLVLLVVTLVLSLLYERAFCKYVCPLGAVNALLSRIPLFRIKRAPSTCISCSKCDHVCPMNVEVSSSGSVDSPECIACMECVTACPAKKGTLETTLGGKTVRVGAVVAVGFAIFAGAALVGQAAGMLHFVAPTLESMAEEGKLSVADIKGSSTYESVAASFGIELERLYREVGIDPNVVPASTMLKETGTLAGIPDFETDTVRVAVARILGVPYAGEDGTVVPENAASETTVNEDSLAESAVTESAVPEKSGALTVPADFALEGTMSVNDIALALNAPSSVVIEKLGLPADFPVDKPLRDLKDQYGYTMPALKERIRE